MKRIYLAKKGKRILSRFVDVLITLILTAIIFIFFVLPNVLDKDQIKNNGDEITELYQNSELFLVDSQGNYSAKCGFGNIKEINDLYQVTCVFGGVTYSDISLTKTLYTYYTTKFNQYGNQYNLSLETYTSDILKVGTTQSNIASYDVENNRLVLIDESKADVTVKYFVNIYASTCENLISNSKINELQTKNQKLVLGTLWWLIPVVMGVSFVFEFLIPLFSPCCETIGKHVFKLGVLSDGGYRLKKIKLLPRWLSYVLLELVLGVLTFGAMVLITYTMFLFAKKRRCLHDKIAKTVVIEKYGSIYFASPEEEAFYINYKKQEEGELDA